MRRILMNSPFPLREGSDSLQDSPVPVGRASASLLLVLHTLEENQDSFFFSQPLRKAATNSICGYSLIIFSISRLFKKEQAEDSGSYCGCIFVPHPVGGSDGI